MVSRLRLITFDATNTLLRYKESVGQTYSGVAQLYGVPADPHHVNHKFKIEFKRMVAQHPNYGAESGMTSQQWWAELVSRTLSGSGAISESLMTSISKHLYESYRTPQCWAPNIGTVETLQQLKNSGRKLGVISNTDERLDSILTGLRLRQYFDFVIASAVVKVEKPSKDIFSLALICASSDEHLTPDHALHVGDNIVLDYLAAKSAGWNALLLVNDESRRHQALSKGLVEPADMIHRLPDIVKVVDAQESQCVR
uniref:Rhythmically expressed gene 2 protein n=1 Tax=Amblyomma triste TaxID=251400 RepID=A0A023GH69_AMBTT